MKKSKKAHHIELANHSVLNKDALVDGVRQLEKYQYSFRFDVQNMLMHKTLLCKNFPEMLLKKVFKIYIFLENTASSKPIVEK